MTLCLNWPMTLPQRWGDMTDYDGGRSLFSFPIRYTAWAHATCLVFLHTSWYTQLVSFFIKKNESISYYPEGTTVNSCVESDNRENKEKKAYLLME